MHRTMLALADCPRDTLAAIEGVLTDIDETVSSHGRLTAEAYGAMEALKNAGFRVVPVTGRPAGWCDHIARFWPVDAVVGENGAFWMWHDHQAASSRRASSRARPSAPTDGAGWRRCAPRCCATFRGRASPPTSPIARPTSPSISARTCRRCRTPTIAASSRIFEAPRRPRQGELDPRQRLVRRLRQAHHQPTDDARAVRSRSRGRRRDATSSPAIRPTTRRCSASFPMPSAWPMCATSPPTWTTCRAGSPRRAPARASSSWRRR